MTKIRTTIYIQEDVKENAKEIFKSLGLSFSDGINLMLNKLINDKKLLDDIISIEPILPNDPDYQYILKGREELKKHPENFGTMEDINWD